jgi:ssDNA-binding Zn-finger/Zn-ribbon topoisomerase 1
MGRRNERRNNQNARKDKSARDRRQFARHRSKKAFQQTVSKRLRIYGKKPPPCPYCGSQPVLKYSNDGRPPVWVCAGWPTCDAKVGVHPDTTVPLGTLANYELRLARIRAHDALDKLWAHNRLSRQHAYNELAEFLGLTLEQAHIGLFDLALCEATAAFARIRLREIYGDRKT